MSSRVAQRNSVGQEIRRPLGKKPRLVHAQEPERTTTS